MQKHARAALAAALFASGCASDSTPPQASNAGRAAAEASTPGSCPATDFPGFLRAYASDDEVRRAHTAPFVDVTDWIDVDETELGTEVERIPRDQYRDFRLRHLDGTFVHIEHDDMPDPIPVQPRVTALRDGYRVEYIFNMSEGNSWTFTRRGDCWQLVADPDPSLL